MDNDFRPINLLIAALGGEGGSVLANWIVAAAERVGYIAQYTSIPGVAQRTGATTYYVELFPADMTPEPVMALTPAPGDVDIVIASELLEVGRAIEKGYVTPQKTLLIGSTHRMFAVSEKSAMTDNRYNSENIQTVATEFAAELILCDFKKLSDNTGSMINACLLGALAATGKLPIGREIFEQIIRDGGKAVESNLQGLSAGIDLVKTPNSEATEDKTDVTPVKQTVPPILANVPEQLHDTLRHGLMRTADYQSQKYARLYRERLQAILDVDKATSGNDRDFILTQEVARYLALRMTYEDVIRVADLKTREDRFLEIMEKAGGQGKVIEVLDYFKPGIAEIRDVLPPFLSKLLAPLEAKSFHRAFSGGLKIRTTTVAGFYTMRLLACLKVWRPLSDRYKKEQRNVEDWLETVISLARENYDLALEYTECANLLKGYGDTYHRGLANFERISVQLPVLRTRKKAATDLKLLREAALNDPDGDSLDFTFTAIFGSAS
ncbi:indolepyruvate oxidoreductase subunit beta family protein [Sneathiella sp.]|jgi:indolepyruvate ferredoxin oxidoreductase beta subunit|uniref:indolepyruvate oxidoreductase subunit beta family protein n=1 Tax=Sneathiella sp. TaxID=1964365 RepID=UPI0039E3217D